MIDWNRSNINRKLFEICLNCSKIVRNRSEITEIIQNRFKTSRNQLKTGSGIARKSLDLGFDIYRRLPEIFRNRSNTGSRIARNHWPWGLLANQSKDISKLDFDPGTFGLWAQHANHGATSLDVTRASVQVSYHSGVSERSAKPITIHSGPDPVMIQSRSNHDFALGSFSPRLAFWETQSYTISRLAALTCSIPPPFLLRKPFKAIETIENQCKSMKIIEKHWNFNWKSMKINENIENQRTSKKSMVVGHLRVKWKWPKSDPRSWVTCALFPNPFATIRNPDHKSFSESSYTKISSESTAESTCEDSARACEPFLAMCDNA